MQEENETLRTRRENDRKEKNGNERKTNGMGNKHEMEEHESKRNAHEP